MKTTALILAGGKGERFWPRSRKNCPKQFLSLTDDGKTITSYTYIYDGYGFVVQVETDAVQTHHARAAIRSAWGMQDEAILSQMKVPTESE